MFKRHSASRAQLLAASLLIAMAASPAALAQNVVGPADVSRVQERTNQPSISQPSDQMVEVQGGAAASAPKGAEKIMLTLNSVSIEGMTVYTVKQVEPLYASQIGKKVSVADVYQIAAELTKKYRNDGYIITQVVVPPQTIEGGSVQIQVVEGFVDNVVVDGVPNDSERSLIESYANRLKGKPLNTRDLERSILLTNDLPGVTARSIISPAAGKPGAANLRVVVQRDPFEGMASLDNYGSRYLGPLQAQVGLSANSLLNLNERITTDFIYAPGGGISKELAYGDLIYRQPVGRFGTSVDLSTSYASTDPGYRLKEFDVEGQSFTYSIRVNQPIVRTRGLNWSVYGLFDSRNNKTESNINPTTEDLIRAVRLGTKIDFLDGIFGAGYNSASIELAHGLDIFGASDSGDANLSRAAGDPQFTKVTAELQRLQRVTRHVNLLVAGKAQLSNDAMLSSEEFGVGGPSYGRGYDPSEIVGDDGVAGKIELQVNDPIPFEKVKTYQVYAFLDGGRVWNDDPSTPSDEEISIASTGFGVRTTLRSNTDAGIFVAFPLNRDVEALGNEDARVYFNLGQRF